VSTSSQGYKSPNELGALSSSRLGGPVSPIHRRHPMSSNPELSWRRPRSTCRWRVASGPAAVQPSVTIFLGRPRSSTGREAQLERLEQRPRAIIEPCGRITNLNAHV